MIQKNISDEKLRIEKNYAIKNNKMSAFLNANILEEQIWNEQRGQ